MTGPILPPATIGIIGGGQLGQMMALAAKSMGYKIGVLDPDQACSAGQVADFQVVAAYDDAKAVASLAQASDLLTYEFENVSIETLQTVIRPIPQGERLLEITSNRIAEKTFIKEVAQVAVTDFQAVKSKADFTTALAQIGYPAILKTSHGGYDGHGQWNVNAASDAQRLLADFPAGELILEARVAFDKELSIMVTRDAQGKLTTWPIAQNFHQNHILHRSYAPAAISDTQAQKIESIAHKIAVALNLQGVLGIELFVTEQEIWVNELAPRPHNSGHYTIEACNISQFEGHIRSITGLTLPPITQEQPAMMLNLLGEDIIAARQALVDHPEWHFHDYGKGTIRPQRKMGHITVIGDSAIKALEQWGQAHDQDEL
ncbi:5-(carboxyamino)imidazole ribonucleotide synthase [Convivina intestini]|uniref:5-(carboxyamino)imidazole ribonucleotide synthase n=1 Tax=Convivina intestini TaxID=1505726 RepID=UPI00200F17DB|nr:5-(carboxyamino)imidazole ribonucleotide synthase [Convivina intestini]CAH1851630.1 N5-carboxyaminoimidazole ribonucleotide synthase [Convivina intestini]